MELIDYLLEEHGVLTTPRIIEAFRAIERKHFLPQELRDLSGADEALPIGFGQTISQPAVVAFMIEQLQPKKGDKLLDLGAGSGWTTALLAHIVGLKGRVIAIDIVPELVEFGSQNIAVYNFFTKGMVKYVCQDGAQGYEKEAPFDGMLVSAALSSKKLPKAWNAQLKIGGRIVAPVQDSLFVFTKKGDSDFEEKEYPGFAFVPFI